MRLHGVGIDLVDIPRIERLARREPFVRRWFTEAEVARCAQTVTPGRSFAELFAAKEAAWKAMHLPWAAGVPWAHLEVGATGQVGLTGPVAAAAVTIAQVWVRAASQGSVAVAAAFAWAAPSLGPERGTATPVARATGEGSSRK